MTSKRDILDLSNPSEETIERHYFRDSNSGNSFGSGNLIVTMVAVLVCLVVIAGTMWAADYYSQAKENARDAVQGLKDAQAFSDQVTDMETGCRGEVCRNAHYREYGR
jgi:hypothetical protein